MSMDNPARPELEIEPGWMNAEGMLGYAPPAIWPLEPPPVAFVTDPISNRPRSPAADRRCAFYPGGMILHTGWPNPGFHKVTQTYRRRWERSSVPIWVHLLAERPYELDKMVRSLEEVDGVAAVEISLPLNLDDAGCLDLIDAALGELPLVLSVPLDQIRSGLISRAVRLGVSAVSVSAPRGVLPSTGTAAIHGRCYGPGLLPLALQALSCLRDLDVPFIAGCGVYDREVMAVMLKAGAAAVKLDTVLWRGWDA